MLGALVGAGFAQIGVSTKWHLLLIGIVTLPVALSFSRGLPEVAPETAEEARRRPVLALPSVSMIGLCVFAFGVVMVEISTRNWIAVYLRDVIGVSPGGNRHRARRLRSVHGGRAARRRRAGRSLRPRHARPHLLQRGGGRLRHRRPCQRSHRRGDRPRRRRLRRFGRVSACRERRGGKRATGRRRSTSLRCRSSRIAAA